MRSFALIVAATALFAGPAAASDRVSIAFEKNEHTFAMGAQTQLATAPAVQKVIARQIDAVRQSDAKAAFAVVTPKLRRQFGNEGAYLNVVKAQFPAIAKARIVSFGDFKRTSFGMTQLVQISDSSGQPWMAFFLVDEEKGDWRIANVVMVKMPATEA